MTKLNRHNVSLRTCGLQSQFPQDGLPQLALSGRSNTLLGRKKLARVSAEPGKTITVNYYCVDNSLYLVDLPGYGYARRSAAEQAKWSALTDSYFRDNSALKLVIQLIDMKVGPTKDDDVMLQWLYETGTPYIIVATKADKLNATQRAKQLQALQEDRMILPSVKIIPFSSLKGQGTDSVWQIIEEIAMQKE